MHICAQFIVHTNSRIDRAHKDISRCVTVQHECHKALRADVEFATHSSLELSDGTQMNTLGIDAIKAQPLTLVDVVTEVANTQAVMISAGPPGIDPKPAATDRGKPGRPDQDETARTS